MINIAGNFAQPFNAQWHRSRKRLLPSGWQRLLLLAAAIFTCERARAQSTPSASESTVPKPATETLVLNPFEVRTDRDVGYIANDTAVGGRLSMNLLEMPADTTILTRGFLDDIGVTNMTDAYNWLVNAQPLEPGNPDYGQNVQIRGQAVAPNTRNYVRFDTTVPEYNTERLEQSRGPNSILFGETPSGGAINTNTKQAKFTNFEELRLRTDTEGSTNLLIDVNRRLTHDLAGRIVLTSIRGRNWRDKFHDDLDGVAGDLTYRPWRNGEIRLEGEVDSQNVSLTSYIYTDQASLWDGVTGLAGPTTGAVPAGLQRFTTDKLVLSPAWDGVLNFRNFAQTTGSGLTLVGDGTRSGIQNFPILSRRSFQIAPETAEQQVRSYVASLTFSQSFDSGLALRISGLTTAVKRTRFGGQSDTSYRRDPNKVLPNLLPNPHYGEVYSESGPGYGTTDQFANDLQINAAYPLELNWLTQNFSVMLQRRSTLFKPINYNYGRSNGSVAAAKNANNAIVEWRYWDDPDAPFLDLPGGSGYDFVRTVNRYTRSSAATNTLQLNTVGHYFRNKLVVVGGVRFDHYTSSQLNSSTYDNLGQPLSFSYVEGEASRRTNTIGFTYFPISWIGLYGNYSEGYLPTFPPLAFIETHPYSNVFDSRGKTVGLRFRLLGGAVVGSAGYYQSIEHNRYVGQSPKDINQIWDGFNRPDLYVNNATTNYEDTQDLFSKGYEVDLTANLWKALRLKANFSQGEARQTNTLPGTRAYVAQYLEQWTAAAALGSGNPNQALIADGLANVQNRLSQAADGRETNGSVKWRANLFGTYTFKDGALHGLSLGGGVNFFGRQLIGSPTGKPFEYVYAREYSILTATTSYELKIRKIPVKLAITVANLLDYDDPIYTDVAVYNGNLYRNGYKYIEPRKATFTASFKF